MSEYDAQRQSLIAVMRRMAAATGSTHYGGIDPETVDAGGFSLPGGGMACHLDGCKLRIEVYSLGGVCRLATVLDHKLNYYESEPSNGISGMEAYDADGRLATRGIGLPRNSHGPIAYYGYSPRERDFDRLSAWVKIARGEADRIPWHGRPEDATDDPLGVAIHCHENNKHAQLDRMEIVRAAGTHGPKFAAMCRKIVLGLIHIPDETMREKYLLDAAIDDYRAGVSYSEELSYS